MMVQIEDIVNTYMPKNDIKIWATVLISIRKLGTGKYISKLE